MQILINPTEVTLQASSNRVPFSNDYILDAVDKNGNVMGVLAYKHTRDSVLLVLNSFGRIYKLVIDKYIIKKFEFEIVVEQLLNQANLTIVKRTNEN